MKSLLTIPISIYRTKLKVFFGSVKDCCKAMKKDGVPDYYIEEWGKHASYYNGMYYEEDEHDYRLLWLDKIPVSVDDYGSLVHELSHAVFHILDDKGLKHTNESDEAYAYLIGYLYSEIDVYLARRQK